MKDNIILKWNNQIFESISDLVLCMDKKGHINYMNSSFKDFFGVSISKKDSLLIYDLIDESFETELKNILTQMPNLLIENRQIPFQIDGEKRIWMGHLIQISGLNNEEWIYLILHEKESETAFEKFMMKKMLSISRHFIISKSATVDYQMIAEEMKKLSRAKYVAFNVFEKNGEDFRTAAIAGISKDIMGASKILGFDLIDKKWHDDPRKEQYIANKITTVFNSLSALTGNVISGSLMKILEKTFKTGQVVVVRIMKDNIKIGDFTIIMAKNKVLKHKELLEIFASQIGLFVEKNRTENEYRKIKERLSLVVNAGEHGFWDLNLKTDELFISKSFYKMLGYQPGAFPATLKNWNALVHPDDLKSIIPKIDEKIQNGCSFEEVLRLRCKDGSWRWVSIYGKSYFKDATEEVYRVVGLLVDITELKKTEKELEIINKRLENIIEATNLGTWEWHLKNNSVIINNRWAEIIGYQKSELIPMTFKKWMKFTHPKDYENIKEQLNLISNGKKGFYNLELRMQHKNGHWVWVKSHGKVIEWTKNNQPKFIFGSHEDISKRKILEKNLKVSEKENRLLIEKMEQGLAVHEIICDENNQPIDYRFLSVNKKFEEQTGLKAENVIGKRVLEILPETEPYWINAYGKVSLTGEPMHYENYSSEINRWFKVSAYSPKPKQVAVLVDDITERKKMENDLYLEKEQFKTTLLSLGEGVISTDAFGNIVVMNKVAAHLTDWQVEEATGKNVNEVFQIKKEISEDIISDLVQKVLTTNRIFGPADHIVLLSKSGNKFPIEVTASSIKGKRGDITGVVIVFNDISERREKEKQIEYLSFHDALTGLYNRRYLEETLKRLDVKRNLPLSIMILDVNGLKLTNDAFGHAAGDELLIQVSNALRNVCREDEIIGRIGGDEFSIVLPHTSYNAADRIKERILEEIELLKDSKVVISLAIGCATKTSLETNINDIRNEADNKMYKNKLKYGKVMRNMTIDRIIAKINRDYIYEEEHTQEVAKLCAKFGMVLSFRDAEIEEIRMAGLLHDIGKISIPTEILMKTEKLKNSDYDLIRRHPETGYQILKSVDQYVKIAEAVLHHHEYWDGTGYPEGLTKEEIPLNSRILSIADAYQAMTSERTYRRRKTKSEAISELKNCAGKQFDPRLVNIFINEVLI